MRKKFSVEGSFTSLTQIPNLYVQHNNYISKDISAIPPNSFPVYQRQDMQLKPEEIQNIGLTLNYHLSDTRTIALHYFRQDLSNGLTTQLDEPDDPLPPSATNYLIGYANSDYAAVLNGIQLSTYGRSIEGVGGSLHLFVHFGNEKINEVNEIDSYRSVPGVSLYYTLSSDYNNNKNQSGISFRYESAFIDHVSLSKGQVFSPKTKRSFNLDWSNNMKFGKNLYLILKIQNLFKTRYNGVFYNWMDGNGFSYVPQTTRIFSFGLKYRLN